jgi:hypothetical protein
MHRLRAYLVGVTFGELLLLLGLLSLVGLAVTLFLVFPVLPR